MVHSVLKCKPILCMHVTGLKFLTPTWKELPQEFLQVSDVTLHDTLPYYAQQTH